MSEAADPGAVPLLVNVASGSAGKVLPTLQANSRISLRELSAQEFPSAIQQCIDRGHGRILFCGGDGTLSLAASYLAGRDVEMGVIPGGTLNHFAARLDLPEDPAAALELALKGSSRPVDAGFINDRLFLNTSSLGAYVTFVRQREHLEQRMSYQAASLIAGLRRLWRWRRLDFTLQGQHLRSPLLFIGLHERDLSFPQLGQPKVNGDKGLHLIALTTGSAWETLQVGFNALVRGIDPLVKTNRVKQSVLTQLQLTARHRHRRKITVAIDGELVRLRTPLDYRFEEGALNVVGARQSD